jgi:hypothetical protein
MVIFCCVQKWTDSVPWICKSPKNELFQPVNGNQAIGAGTPTLMPIMPALKWCLNCQAADAHSVGCLDLVLYVSKGSGTVLLSIRNANTMTLPGGRGSEPRFQARTEPRPPDTFKKLASLRNIHHVRQEDSESWRKSYAR